MNEKTYSGEALEKALREGALGRGRHVSVSGMVKTSEKSGCIGFTMAGCDNWIDLPTGSIHSAEFIGTGSCRDHSHPVMRITLNEPRDAEGEILMAVLAQAQRGTAVGRPAAVSPLAPPTSVLLSNGLGSGLGNGGFNGWGGWNPWCIQICNWEFCGSSLPGYPPPMCYVCYTYCPPRMPM